MKYLLLFLSFQSLLFIAACNEPDKGSLKSELLLNCWTYSYEESKGADSLLFRPCDFMDFPASHFRDRFTLSANNEATYLQLSPVDAHQNVIGTWHYDDGSRMLTIKQVTGDTVYSYQVNELTADKLILKPN